MGRSSGEPAGPGGGQQAEETGEHRAAEQMNTSSEAVRALGNTTVLSEEFRARMGVGGESGEGGVSLGGRGQPGEGGVSLGRGGEGNVQVETSGSREAGEAG